MEEFDLILKDIEKVMEKHGVEMRIENTIKFVKIEVNNKKYKNPNANGGIRKNKKD